MRTKIMKQKYFQRKYVLSLCVLGLMSISVVVFAMTASDFTGCSVYGYGCIYKIVWDGWRGSLILRPDGTGTLEQIGRGSYGVRHQILLNPQDIIDGRQGPGYLTRSEGRHRIVFWVDFNNTSDTRDDQRFDGYMMTQTKDAIAGITWWNNIPFGFYATDKISPLI